MKEARIGKQLALMSLPEQCSVPRDILVMIVEELADDSTCLRKLRFVSRLLDDIVVPILYRYLDLTNKLLEAYVLERELSVLSLKPKYGNAAATQRVQLQMRCHTRHITIDRSLSSSTKICGQC